MTRVQAILEEMRESRGEPTRILADRLLAAHRADLEEALQQPEPSLHARVVEALLDAAGDVQFIDRNGAAHDGANLRALAAELQDKAIVPREPTEKMLDAMSWYDYYYEENAAPKDVRAAYLAMLQAGESDE